VDVMQFPCPIKGNMGESLLQRISTFECVVATLIKARRPWHFHGDGMNIKQHKSFFKPRKINLFQGLTSACDKAK
jgi:hypothetical protein